MQNKGFWYALTAYSIWGLFPIYWKWLHQVDAVQLIGHRIIWSFAILFIIVLVTRQLTTLRKAAFNRRVLTIYLVAAILIAINWLMYVWAVNQDYIVETSLGYFINPLLSVLLGVIFLRERLRSFQWVPIGLAFLGVLYLTILYGRLPWIALVLAVSFGSYGLIKKLAPLGSLFGLTIETGILFLPAVFLLIYDNQVGSGVFLHATPQVNLLLVGAGLVTTIPLLLFASATQRIPLTMVGILQYITPTIQFLLGTLVYHEPFSQYQLIGFGLVWIALIVFIVESIWSHRTVTAQPIPELGEG